MPNKAMRRSSLLNIGFRNVANLDESEVDLQSSQEITVSQSQSDQNKEGNHSPPKNDELSFRGVTFPQARARDPLRTRFGSHDTLPLRESVLNNEQNDSLPSRKVENRTQRRKKQRRRHKIFDDPAVVAGYASVPLIELERLPRGGLSFETKAVGRIQFGIPPETIKDSMSLGLGVPSIFIVPVERFCREIGPALGINLAEFEFPAYFNYFVRLKRCILVVDSDAENSIRRVFSETLLGPKEFRNHSNPKANEEEDFARSFPKQKRPNFYKEFYHFRTAEAASNYNELTIDMLINFCHFKGTEEFRQRNRVPSEKLGVPPPPPVEVATYEDSTKRKRRNKTFIVVEHDQSKFGSMEIDASCNKRLPAHLKEVSRRVGGLNILEEGFDNLKDEGQNQPLRRVSSDPNVKRLSLDSMSQCTTVSPASEASPDSERKGTSNRGSMDSTTSFMSRSGRSRDGMSWADGASFMVTSDDEDDPTRNTWMYSQAKWLGEVATIYPPTATEEDKANNDVARVEIFRMTGGTEYIVHDIDERNIIVGKARFSGTVRVPDEIAVEGFLSSKSELYATQSNIAVHSTTNEDDSDDEDPSQIDFDKDHREITNALQLSVPPQVFTPTFHPPSFGVTVLGNSHGFDKNGSVSGYVLWLNGRGVMIDPPPYSSATLEREGIRPQMIIAIIVTHCHADHDAGTFQKVMTGLRVTIITTPTIYKSFIRKYEALSGLSQSLLAQSHRYRAAIIGQALNFQGANFNFFYTLHTIPCIGFKVAWRGRSMVFTGDHLNNPPVLDRLESTGVLARERADDLRQLPLQPCDVLLHEAGAPPIHTPLSVLRDLPSDVRDRLYVVHTSALPDDCGLRVAPTGTAGTIRLDQLQRINAKKSSVETRSSDEQEGTHNDVSKGGVHHQSQCALTNMHEAGSVPDAASRFSGIDPSVLDDGGYPNLSVVGDLVCPLTGTFRKHGGRRVPKLPPLVFLRPPCISDAWFILNLLSAIPFISSLSFANTMELLDIAQIEMFDVGEVVLPAEQRSDVVCVVWEGTCVEQDSVINGEAGTCVEQDFVINGEADKLRKTMIPDYEQHYESVFTEGIDSALLTGYNPTIWHSGDWTGPVALQPDIERSDEKEGEGYGKDVVALSPEGVKVIKLYMSDLLPILGGSDLFRKYLALKEKQEAEETAMRSHMIENDPTLRRTFNLNNAARFDVRIASHLPAHWNAYDSLLEVIKCNSALGKLSAHQKRHLESLAEGPRFFEAGEYLWQVGSPVDFAFLVVTGTASFSSKNDEQYLPDRRASTGVMFAPDSRRRRTVDFHQIQEDKQLFNVPPNSEYARLEIGLQLRVEEMELDLFDQTMNLLPKEQRMRNARDRFANKVLARLYSRRAFTSGLVFSRGHWLSDTSRMVSGTLANTQKMKADAFNHHRHTSNMVAGKEGCAVMVFQKKSLVEFLKGNPGVLLSLLGTQVVV